ncbi:hypothetical protein ZWY2020_002790 [Hordeum vulgare]|nr:hypothetical protein ZWY2020_002790 [Hordeum vulgare]
MVVVGFAGGAGSPRRVLPGRLGQDPQCAQSSQHIVKWKVAADGNQLTLESHLAMKSLVQLFNDREIQLFVLLSFTIQLYLFFVGGLRRSITNGALRFSIWQSSKAMAVVRKLVNVVCGPQQKLWISKLLDTKFVEVDEKVVRCIVQRIKQYQSADESRVQLSRYAPTTIDSESGDALVRVCRMMSNYMVYLLATHHEMLPIQTSYSQRDLAGILDELASVENNNIMHKAVEVLTSNQFPEPPEECTEAQLLEIQEAWVGLLLHAASKSRPEDPHRCCTKPLCEFQPQYALHSQGSSEFFSSLSLKRIPDILLFKLDSSLSK